MTVHKSKDWEFDEVVLLELTNLMHERFAVPASRAPDGPPTRVVLRMSRELAAFPDDFQWCMAARASDSIQDALSVLYVAMTRARNALHGSAATE